jgi:hypothetical protein
MTEEKKADFLGKLARWLDEREIDLSLLPPENVEVGEREDGIEFDYNEPEHNNLQAGDVVLLSNELMLKEAIRPLYLAVLRNWEDDYWLFAPFSPYSEPATDNELRMESDDFGLRVLCLWNSHTARRETLAKSWFIGKLSDVERKDALSVFWHSIGTKELPDYLNERVGAQLLHSEDPRRAYICEQLALLALVRDETLEGAEDASEAKAEEQEAGKVIKFSVWKKFLEDDGQKKERLAAAEDQKKAMLARYGFRGIPVILTIRSIPRHNQVVFELDSEDEEARKRIDQFVLVLKGIKEPELTFKHGECVHEVSMDEIEFELRSPEGEALSPFKIKEDD